MSTIAVPPIASEHQEQVALIEWWSYAHKKFEVPEFALFAIPNGGVRHVVVAVKLKAEGVRSGIPDLLLAVPIWPHAGLFIEMKARNRTARVSTAQREVMDYLNAAGYYATAAFGANQAIERIEAYMKSFAQPQKSA